MSLSFCLFRGSFLVSPPPENFPSFFLMLLFLSNWSIGTSWRTGLFFIMSNLQYHLQNKACSGSSPTGRFLTVSFINYSDLGKRKINRNSVANSQDEAHSPTGHAIWYANGVHYILLHYILHLYQYSVVGGAGLVQVQAPENQEHRRSKPQSEGTAWPMPPMLGRPICLARSINSHAHFSSNILTDTPRNNI